MSLDRDVEQFLRACVLTREEVDRFLDPNFPKWATFDGALGHVPHQCEVPDGADGSQSTYSYEVDGARRVVNHGDTPSRVSSYGNSFTQGVQVSDGQTWQEALAAQFGEPVRNYGVGGYGVYQALRRLEQYELAATGHPFVLLNIYLPDHHRSIDAYRLPRLGRGWRDYDLSLNTSMFHGNPWDHARLDETGSQLHELPNPCPSPESLYRLCEEEFVVETFQDDFASRLVVAILNDDPSFLDGYRELAAALEVDGGPSLARRSDRSLRNFYDAYAFRVSTLLLERLQRQVSRAGKQLFVLLSYPSETVVSVCKGEQRPDESFLRSLNNLGIPFVDGLKSHVDDYAAFSLTPEDYVSRYYSGHYNPAGNQFFALAVREAVRHWLAPPPPAYRPGAPDASVSDVTAVR